VPTPKPARERTPTCPLIISRSRRPFRPFFQERTLRLDIAVLSAVPELEAVLPPTAIGKDYPYEGDWFGPTPSRTSIYASLGSYLGLTIGWVEGLEINFFGAVLGFDIRRPALKFPGIGRLGVPAF
jgi:hypothetical protein